MSKVPAGRDAALSPYASVPTLAQAYRSGVVSPVEVAEISLARLEALEPQLNAVIEPMRDLALAMAGRHTRNCARDSIGARYTVCRWRSRI